MKELRYCNGQIVGHQDRQYMFDGIQYEIMPISPPEREIFQFMMEKRMLPTEEKYRSRLFPIIRQIKTGKFFTEKPVELQKGEVEEGAYIMSFPVVHTCNLRCRYCFAHGVKIIHTVKKP